MEYSNCAVFVCTVLPNDDGLKWVRALADSYLAVEVLDGQNFDTSSAIWTLFPIENEKWRCHDCRLRDGNIRSPAAVLDAAILM
jgi:hypothetical protein